eukprot:scaffold35358_cov15-Tisochrysis_lutea.AAC.1
MHFHVCAHAHPLCPPFHTPQSVELEALAYTHICTQRTQRTYTHTLMCSPLPVLFDLPLCLPSSWSLKQHWPVPSRTTAGSARTRTHTHTRIRTLPPLNPTRTTPTNLKSARSAALAPAR